MSSRYLAFNVVCVFVVVLFTKGMRHYLIVVQCIGIKMSWFVSELSEKYISNMIAQCR